MNPIQSPSHRFRRRRASAGFTMVELMVVIVIVALLVAISGAVFSKMKRRANSTNAVQSMHQIAALVLGLAAEQRRLPNEGAYPDPADDVPADTSWDGAVLEYMGATDIIPSTPPQVPLHYEGLFHHRNDYPAAITKANAPTARRTFVFLRPLSDLPIAAIRSPSRTGMLGEHPWRTDDRNRVGFKSASFMDINAMIPDPKSGNDLNPGGKFNFVFIDGHLETMTREESVGNGSTQKPGGLWTIDPND